MISQSGNVAVNAIGSKRGIGFHTMVSTGNQAVLDTGDWLASIAELDGVRAIALFQETDGDGAKLAEALATCAEREIGVAVLKVGTSQAGQAAAAAHTGAIAGDQKVFRALIEEAGAAWATDPHELLETHPGPGRAPRPAPAGPQTGPAGYPHLFRWRFGNRRRPGRRARTRLRRHSAGDDRAAGGAPARRGDGRPTRSTTPRCSGIETDRLTEIVATVGATPRRRPDAALP